MYYIIIFILLFFLELLYIKIAKFFKIIDIPNVRSSHIESTIRGGGIIIWISCLIYFLLYNLRYPCFIIAISILGVISFWDDIKTISSKYRLSVQLISLLILLYEVYPMPYSFLSIPFIIVISLGIVNGFNFMDGINGITVSYSLISIFSFAFLEKYMFHYIDINFIIFIFLSLIVFGFFNFRTKAKVFAGDVGSVSIAFIFVFLQLLIYKKTENIVFLFMFIVYGIDIIYTLLLRIKNKENILKAHRTHLFQLLKNEKKIDPLLISIVYALLQLIFNIGLFYVWNSSTLNQLIYLFFSISIYVSIYIAVRKDIIYTEK
jgi:UDP-GlcNAc:undecaprenyl-phosphate/decaprenyl-phosphate GlcNAc-1-phosphate transferase